MAGLIRRTRKSPFMSLKEAGALLRLDPSTIRKRGGGTEGLTHVQPAGEGGKILLVAAEVEAHAERLISSARERQIDRPLRLAAGVIDRPTGQRKGRKR